MTLYALRKKIQERLVRLDKKVNYSSDKYNAIKDEIRFFEQELRDFELELSSRVSQLEKEPAFCENCSLKCIASDCICDCHSRYRAARVSINELREVLGNEK